jgi:hypothetical protein
MCQWSLFWIKKRYVSSSCVFDLKKKSVLKLLDRPVYSITARIMHHIKE